MTRTWTQCHAIEVYRLKKRRLDSGVALDLVLCPGSVADRPRQGLWQALEPFSEDCVKELSLLVRFQHALDRCDCASTNHM